MSNQKAFIAQQGSSGTIKIFDVATGQLYRVIAVGGDIVSPPYVAGNVVTVTTQTGSGSKMVKTFSLPGGGLKSAVALS